MSAVPPEKEAATKTTTSAGRSGENHKVSFGHRITYYLYKVMCIGIKCTDVRAVALFGRGIGYLVWLFAARRRKIVARNLRIVVDPTLRGRRLNSMVRRNIVRTTMNLACSLKTGLMKQREMEKSIRLEGAEHFEKCGSNGHTVISCIPHAGNWEVLARIRPYFRRVPRFASMYRRLSNPLLEDFVYLSRTRYGCEMYSKESGLREVLKLAKGGGLLGVLSDQFTNEGVYLPYFGKVTGVTPLPALIYKRCKGKGHLFSVFTRNTGLGRWDAVLGREINLPENCESLSAITMQVNLALEQCQNENILDGFWMHHRWKSTNEFAHAMDAETREFIRQYAKLPFRILIVEPDSAKEAEQFLPSLQRLKNSRVDAEITILCKEGRMDFWKKQGEVTFCVPTDGRISPMKLLEADEIYANGPFDILLMLGGSHRLWRQLQKLFPLSVFGWKDHPLSRHFRWSYKRAEDATGPHTAAEYEDVFTRYHHLPPLPHS